MATGESGVGKTFEALHWAVSVATGATLQESFAPVQQGAVLVLSYEDAGAVIRRRLDAIAAAFPTAKETLWRAYGEGLLQFYCDVAEPLFESDSRRTLDKTSVFRELEEVMLDKRPALVLIDPLSGAALLREENSNTEMAAVAAGLSGLARRTDSVVMLLHHTSKLGARNPSQQSARGGSALTCRARWIAQLTAEQKDGLRLTVVKDSYSALPAPVALRRSEGGVLVETFAATTDHTQLAKAIAAWLEDDPQALVTEGGLGQRKGDANKRLYDALKVQGLDVSPRELKGAVQYGLAQGLLKTEQGKRNNRGQVAVLRSARVKEGQA